MKRKSFVIILILFIVHSVCAEQFMFSNFHASDGLSNGMTTSCIQDKHGYIWIGTRDGLNRYNGYGFSIFRHNSSDPKSIGADYITGLALDNKDNLWVATYKGIYRYYEEDETFELIPFTENEYTTNLQSDQHGNLWFLMNSTIWRYDIEKKMHTSYIHPTSNIFTTYCLKNDFIYGIDLDGVLYKISTNKNTSQTCDLFADSDDYNSKRVTVVVPSKNSSHLYIGTRTRGFLIFDIDEFRIIENVVLRENSIVIPVVRALEVDDDNLFLGTNSGLYLYSKKSNTYVSTRRDALDRYSLAGISISALYKDRENGIWIGSYPGGVSYYSPSRLFSVFYQKSDPNSIRGEVVRKMAADKYGNIWVGMQDEGLNCYDSKTSRFTNIPVGKSGGISQTNIPGLAVTGDTLWVGNIFGGVDILHIPTKRVIKNSSFDHTNVRYPSSVIVNMYVTKDNQVLAATDRGIYRYDSRSGKFVLYSQIPIQLTRVQCIYEDDDNVLWIGMVNGGIYCYSTTDNRGHYLDYDTIHTYGSRTVNDIYEDKNGKLWFATMDGLKQYDRTTQQVTRYRTNEGLPSNVTFCILPDEDENLWISTAKGLVYFIKETEETRVYTEANGLITSQFNYNAGVKGLDGTHYFGSTNGVISYDPQEVKQYHDNLNVQITSLTITKPDNQSEVITLYNDENRKNIILKPDQSTFQLSFSTFSYVASKATEFTFRINNGSWSQPSGWPGIRLASLPPGKYNIEVMGRTIYGTWNEEGIANLKVTILPPWWRSTVAYYIYGLLAMCLVVSIAILFIRLNEKDLVRNAQLLETEKEKELYQSKIDFFTNIAHEIRTPLTLIKTPLDRLIKKEKVSDSAKRSLILINKNTNHLLELVNQLLDFRKAEQQNYHLNFIHINIVTLLESVVGDYKQAIEDENKILTVDIPLQQLNVNADRVALVKIFNNLMTNAVKYSDKIINVKLNASAKEGQFIIDFSNDGGAIAPELTTKIFEPFFRENETGKPGSGLGLPLARSLVEMHNGTLTLEHIQEGMNTFRLILPLDQPAAVGLSDSEKQSRVDDIENYRYEEGRPNILVAEDNKEMLHFIGYELNETYNVHIAENGQEALDILLKESVHLVISDIMMPVMDGLELLRQIKSSSAHSHIPVILLTAKTTAQSKLEGLELKADAYIEKPFDMEMLLAQITSLLANRENIREFYFHSPIANLKTLAHSKLEEDFLNKINELILENISNPNLGVNLLAEQMNMSRSVLYRKIKAISNRTPNDLIKISRLKKAAEILQTQDLKIYEVAEMVGFNSQSYFYYSFIKQFDISPSQYAKLKKGG